MENTSGRDFESSRSNAVTSLQTKQRLQIKIEAGPYFRLNGVTGFSRLLCLETDTQIGTQLEVGVNFWQYLVLFAHLRTDTRES